VTGTKVGTTTVSDSLEKFSLLKYAYHIWITYHPPADHFPRKGPHKAISAQDGTDDKFTLDITHRQRVFVCKMISSAQLYVCQEMRWREVLW